MPRDDLPEGAASFLAGLSSLRDYGTVSVRGNGQITLPKSARDELRLAASDMWRVFGLPQLGVAVIVNEPFAPREALELLIRGGASR